MQMDNLMKRLILLALCALLLAGCGNKPYQDNLAPYRHLTAKQLYQGATHQLQNEDYSDAAKQLSAMDAIYPFGPYAQKGQLEMIYAYYMDDDKVSAQVAADRYIHLYPQGKAVDYAYYMKGLIEFRQGMTWLQKMYGSNPSARDMSTMEESFAAFNQLVQRFPHSNYRNDALLRMTYIRNLLAQHQIAVGDYYLKRKAYVAAANRANYVIAHFEGTPSIKDALNMDITAYQKLGLAKREALYRHLMQVNFPPKS